MALVKKSSEAFRTISEVAEILDVPAHVLRFWESRFTQIKPVKRGGGRRYYRPQDIDLLCGIRNLLHHEGYTIKGVQKILREEGVKHVASTSHIDLAEIAEAPPAAKAPVEKVEETPVPAPSAEAPPVSRPLQEIRVPKPQPPAEQEMQFDLFARPEEQARPAFPPDPAQKARLDEIRTIYDKLVRIRARMAAASP